MRPVELVVRYLEGEPLPDRCRFDWAGVFICSEADEVEEAFAFGGAPRARRLDSDNLPKGNAKTFVRVALKRLNEVARPHFNQTISATIPAEKGPSLAATAARISAFLDRVSARGPESSNESSPHPLQESLGHFFTTVRSGCNWERMDSL